MVVVRTPSGRLMSVRRPGRGDVIVRRTSGGGVSTITSPTPSAETLRGTSAEREAQISAFRRGGKSAFEAQRRQAELRMQREALRKAQEKARAEVLRKAQEQSRKIERQRLIEVRKIAEQRAKRLRTAKTSIQRRAISREQAQRIRSVNIKAGRMKRQVQLRIKVSPIKAIRKVSIRFPAKKKKPTKKIKVKKVAKKFLKREKKFLTGEVTLAAGKKEITLTQIQEKIRKKGLAGKVAGVFIPTTIGEIGLFAGVAALGGGVGGKFLQVATSTTLTGLGLKASLTKSLPTEERIAGGLIALGGLISAGSLLRSKRLFIKTKQPKIKITRGKTKTPLSKTFQKEFKFSINDKAVEGFVSSRLKRGGIDFNKLSKIEQNFIKGQVKARIRNQPELFLPKSRQIALKKAKVKNLRSFTKARLKGEFDKPITFEVKKVGKTKTLKPKLTKTQKLALNRFSQRVKGESLRKVVLKNLDKRIKNQVDLLSPKQKARIISQIKAKVKADPTLTLSKTQKLALNKVKRISEIERITGLTKKRLKGELPSKVKLTTKQRSAIQSKIKTLLKAQPEKFIPKQRRLALKRLRRLQEKKVIKRAIKKGARKLKPSDLLSKSDKTFIIRQVQARARASPEVFIPKTRQVALQQLKPQLKAKKIPVVKFGQSGLTSTQKLVLNRQKQIFKQINKASKITKPTEKITTRKGIVSRSKQGQKILQKQKKVVQKQKTSLRQKATTKQKELSGLKTKLKSLQIQKGRARTFTLVKFKTKQIQKLKQELSQEQGELQGIKTLQGNNQKLVQGLRFAQAQPQLQPQLQLQLQKQRKRTLSKLKLKRVKKKKKAILLVGGRVKRGKKITKLLQVFHVKAKVKGKEIRVTTKPLTKNDALDTLFFDLDNSTAKTGRIVPAGKSKSPGKLLKGQKNYAKRQGFKFREFKIRKGRKFKLKNKFIEKRKFGIDTRGERLGLSIRRLLVKQKRKTIRRRPTITRTKARKILRDKKIRGKPITKKQQRFFRSKINKPKRKVSPATLRALAKGRATRLKNLKRRRK